MNALLLWPTETRTRAIVLLTLATVAGFTATGFAIFADAFFSAFVCFLVTFFFEVNALHVWENRDELRLQRPLVVQSCITETVRTPTGAGAGEGHGSNFFAGVIDMDVLDSVRKQLKAQRAQIDAALIALGETAHAAPPVEPTKQRKARKPFSAETRAKMSAAARKRHGIAPANGATGEPPTSAESPSDATH